VFPDFVDPFWPGLLTLGIALALLPCLDRDNEWARGVVIACSLAITARYVFWRLFYTLPPPGFSFEWAIGVVFAAAEGLTILGTSITLVLLSRTCSRSEEVERRRDWLLRQDPAPLVDVFICTYNEGRAILEKTIIAAMAIDYGNFRVWVLDDGARPWLSELCKRLGCEYLKRDVNAGAKAGNINHGLRHVLGLSARPEFVAIFDADFAPMANFLRRTIPLFEDRSIGLVQTPQYFRNPDPIQSAGREGISG
jgi:cellulose synthase (UDP-forming)